MKNSFLNISNLPSIIDWRIISTRFVIKYKLPFKLDFGNPLINTWQEKLFRKDINLDPDYQRNYIWTNKKASLLIESILLSVPIPVVYVAEEEDGRWTVIDGLQRLNSIKRFANNEFRILITKENIPHVIIVNRKRRIFQS